MYAGLWLFAWDLADEGVDHVMGWAAESGVSTLQIAGAYHAGWFLHPHNPKHRAYMVEDGCVYFHPESSRYAGLSLQPRVAQTCRETDWMRAAASRLATYGLGLVSWTVCCHNTRLGLLHPECTVRNCFGDSYPHALCPANPDVIEYLCALCSDLANNLPLEAVQLEAAGYLGWAHGHHHERDLTALTAPERRLMDLCFCPSCRAAAGIAGIDADRLAHEVSATLTAAFNASPNRPAGHPATARELEEQLPELSAFERFRKDVENSLVRTIREAMRPSVASLFLLGPYTAGTAQAVSAYNLCLYGQSAEAVHARTTAARTEIGAENLLYVCIRLGGGSIKDAADLRDIVRAISDAGGDGVMFYNYSESPITALRWINHALR